jgi:hypothetical protein
MVTTGDSEAKVACRVLPVLITLSAAVALVGCVTEPIVYRVRVRPEIVDVGDRAISFQLITPSAAAPERVICSGVLVSALLEASSDTLDEFGLGYIKSGEWNRGPIKVIIQESGESQVFSIGAPPSGGDGTTVYVAASVPRRPEPAAVRWQTRAR